MRNRLVRLIPIINVNQVLMLFTVSTAMVQWLFYQVVIDRFKGKRQFGRDFIPVSLFRLIAESNDDKERRTINDLEYHNRFFKRE